MCCSYQGNGDEWELLGEIITIYVIVTVSVPGPGDFLNSRLVVLLSQA